MNTPIESAIETETTVPSRQDNLNYLTEVLLETAKKVREIGLPDAFEIEVFQTIVRLHFG